ncbi:MAG: SAM-dependent methyltransferase [Parachlamydiales bacterium]|nr:SAM-dependent methyltransferase [Parachlamydiales bacterium]
MTLYVLPNLLSDDASISKYLPEDFKKIVLSLDGIICESEKEIRRFLLKVIDRDDFQKLKICLLNEHTTHDEIISILKNIKDDENWGLFSDAGLPCIADPGSNLIFLAKQKNIKIDIVPGPSSIIFALILSGLNSQNFSFHGYLPRKDDELLKMIKKLSERAKIEKSTEVFIEAPYRSDKMLTFLLNTLDDDIYLSLAISLTSKDERVITKKVKDFKKNSKNIVIGKSPTVFLFSYVK